MAHSGLGPEWDWRCFRGCVISSSHGRLQDFFQGAANSGMQKVDDLFLVVTLKIQVFTVTTNAQNTSQHFRGGGRVPSKHLIFFEGGACAMAQWPVQALFGLSVSGHHHHQRISS